MTISKEITANFINEVDMNNLMLLNTDQVIDQRLTFNTITVENDIPVGNLVNGYKLEQEFYNTVMVSIKFMQLMSYLPTRSFFSFYFFFF